MAEQPTRQRTRLREQEKRPRDSMSVDNGSDGGAGGGGPKPPRGPSGDGTGGKPSTSWRALAAVGAVAAIAVAGYFAFFSGPAVDSVSQADSQSRASAYQGLLASPGFALDLVAPGDVDKAIASMPKGVTEQQRDQVRSDVNQGRVKLAWLTVWDTQAEDGDIVRLQSSASFPIEVMALNAKTTIAIPYPADGKVLVTGVRDGGGGITVALQSGSALIDWPTMAPGDTLNLPVTQGF